MIWSAGGITCVTQGFLSPWLLRKFHPRWLVINGIAMSGVAMALVTVLGAVVAHVAGLSRINLQPSIENTA